MIGADFGWEEDTQIEEIESTNRLLGGYAYLFGSNFTHTYYIYIYKYFSSKKFLILLNQIFLYGKF